MSQGSKLKSSGAEGEGPVLSFDFTASAAMASKLKSKISVY
jgi:hypothetical protein